MGRSEPVRFTPGVVHAVDKGDHVHILSMIIIFFPESTHGGSG